MKRKIGAPQGRLLYRALKGALIVPFTVGILIARQEEPTCATLTCLKSDPWSVPSFSGRRNYFEDAPEKSEDALRSLFTCVGRCLRGTLFPWDGRFLIPYITCCTVPCLPSECS